MIDPGLSVILSDRVALVTLDKPTIKNAVNSQLLNALIAAFDRIDENDEVRCIVLAGNGDHFCAGADLSKGAQVFDAAKQGRPEDAPDLGGVAALRILSCRKPVIAAVQGIAAGFGASITLACDLRIAAKGARFAFPFLARGLCPDACASWLLPRLVGAQRAAYWLYSARVISAEEALAADLVLEVTDIGSLRARALSLAQEIATRTSAVALAFTKRLLMLGQGSGAISQIHRLESRFIRYMSARPDLAEGVQSFLEKRAPNFPMTLARDLPPFFPEWPEKDEGAAAD
jgi:enoyl-CoA hydratase/carnithine racemase